LHPTFVAPYANMGMCYLELGQFDSAGVMLRIAAGMNPYNYTVLSALGRLYFEQGNYRDAEKTLLRAHRLAPDKNEPLAGLIRLYEKTGDVDKWLEYLKLLVARDNAPLQSVTQLAEFYLGRGNLAQAARLYRRAVTLGLDSTYVNQLRRDYPQLRF